MALSIIKSLIKVFLILFLAVVIAIIAMIGAYSLPTKPMFNNLKDTISIFQKEGTYYHWAGKHVSSRLDNYTNSIMLRNAIFPK